MRPILLTMIIKGVVFHINKIKILKKLVWLSVDFFFFIGHSVDLFVNILYVTKLCSDKFVSFWMTLQNILKVLQYKISSNKKYKNKSDIAI